MSAQKHETNHQEHEFAHAPGSDEVQQLKKKKKTINPRKSKDWFVRQDIVDTGVYLPKTSLKKVWFALDRSICQENFEGVFSKVCAPDD